jgi:hypothetical protein
MFLLLCFHFVLTAQGWNSDAHKMVAKTVSTILSRKTARFITSHIKDKEMLNSKRMTRLAHALVSVSAWPDFIAVSDESMAWSTSLHFAHTPHRACERFAMERDCPKGKCIVSAIADFINQASDFDASKESREEALKFLIHLLADIHNPMHIGFQRDLGGNLISLDLEGFETKETLHHVWDDVLVDMIKAEIKPGAQWWEAVGTRAFSVDPFERSAYSSIPLSKDDILGFAIEIASETAVSVTCNYGYKHENGEWIREHGDRLSEEYLRTRKDFAREQLKKSVVRLVQVLEFVSQQYYETEASRVNPSVIPEGLSLIHPNPFQNLTEEETLEDFVYELEDPMDVILPEDGEVSEIAIVPREDQINESDAPRDILPERLEEKTGRKSRSKKRNTVVLIKRGSRYWVVRKSSIESDDWIPEEGFSYMFPSPSGGFANIRFEYALLEGYGARGNDRALQLVEKALGKSLKLSSIPAEIPEKGPDGRRIEYVDSWAEFFSVLVKRYGTNKLGTVPYDFGDFPNTKKLREYYPEQFGKAAKDLQWRYITDQLEAYKHQLVAIRYSFGKTLVTRKDWMESDLKILKSTGSVNFNLVMSTRSGIEGMSDDILLTDIRLYDCRINIDVSETIDRLSGTSQTRRNSMDLMTKKHPLILSIPKLHELLVSGDDPIGPLNTESKYSILKVNRVIRESAGTSKVGPPDTVQIIIRKYR